ncbi:MAG: ATP-binding protein [Desulfobacterales bacterium]|nr:ATP-binding protein [Desulfobacterales bacterium]
MNNPLVISATLENLEPLMAHGRDAAAACGMDTKTIAQVELALEEVLVNVINYAYGPDQDHASGDIELDCSCDSGKSLILTVTDQGPAFDPLERPDPDTTLSVEERGIGGLGIFLAKQMMDSVSYRRSQGKNILTLVKNSAG